MIFEIIAIESEVNVVQPDSFREIPKISVSYQKFLRIAPQSKEKWERKFFQWKILFFYKTIDSCENLQLAVKKIVDLSHKSHKSVFRNLTTKKSC